MYRFVMRSCGAVAVVGSVVYITAAIGAAIEGPESALRIPVRLNMIFLAALTFVSVLAAAGWMIRVGNRASAQQDIQPIVAAELASALESLADRLAAAVTQDVAGLLEQRLHKVADKTAAAATARTIAAVRETAAGERALLMADLEVLVETVRVRAHTGGMIVEANTRAGNGTVASINRGRDT